MRSLEAGQTADNYELMALGELCREFGGDRIALSLMGKKNAKSEFMRQVTAKANEKPLTEAADALLGFDSHRDGAGYSISRAITAASEERHHAHAWDKAGLEQNISNLATTKSGKVPNGFFVPLSLLATRDFNLGTSTEAGNLLGTSRDGQYSRDPLRRVTPLARLGATFFAGLSDTLKIPSFSSSSTAGFKSEIAAATVMTENTRLADLTPKRIAVTMVISRQAARQSTIALDAYISRHLVGAIMEQLEYGALNGDGTSDTPVGVRSHSGINTVTGGANGAQIAWTHLADIENAPSAANSPESPYSGFLINTSTRRWLRTLARGTNLPYAWDGGPLPLLGHAAEISKLLPSDLVKGSSGAVCSSLIYSNDWSSLIIGMYGGGVDVLVDPVTMADVGQIRITAALHAGVGLTQPAAWTKMDDALTT